MKSKDDLISYGKLKGIHCLPSETVRVMYFKTTGKTFDDLEDEHHQNALTYSFTKIIVQDYYIWVDFQHPFIKNLDIDKYFYYNRKGYFTEATKKIKEDVLIFDVKVIEYDMKFTEIKNHSTWISVKNNYLYIRKKDMIGRYYIIYKKITPGVKIIRSNAIKSKRELEEAAYKQSLENITKNINGMIEDKKIVEFKETNFQPVEELKQIPTEEIKYGEEIKHGETKYVLINEKIISRIPVLTDSVSVNKMSI